MINTPALRWIAVAVVVGVVADLLIRYSRFTGFAALIGLGGFAVIFAVYSSMARFLARGEDLYPDDTAADVQEDLRG